MGSFPSLQIRPYQLMCVVCGIGGDADGVPGREHLGTILAQVREDPGQPLTLQCNVDTVYRYQNPGRAMDTPEGELFNDKRDLDILQRLGLVPGGTRPARELFQRLHDNVASTGGICGDGATRSGAWQGCPRAGSGLYEKGHAAGIGAVIPPRAEEDKARSKEESACAVYEATSLRIRPHHLMCMACFHGGKSDLSPIAEDNLFEAIDVIQRDPDIEVTLVPGCCMICPPCTQYDPASDLCISGAGMALRDQKKDLNVLQRLDLQYGDTLPARELYARLFGAIPSTTEICGYGDGLTRAREWSVCRGPEGSSAYIAAREAGLGIPPAAT